MKKAALQISTAHYQYVKFGKGPNLLIALHGYGEDGTIFTSLEEVFGKDYTIYAPDLPFHGQSQWPAADFNVSDMLALVQAIAKEAGQSRMSLMGYSFGTRVILNLMDHFPEQIDRLYFLSPDGLATPGMRWSLRLPMIFRTLVQGFVQRVPMESVFHSLHKVHLLTYHQYRFMSHHLATAERQERLFAYWRSLDHFALGAKRLKQILGSTKIPIDIYLGEKDQVIKPALIAKAVQGYANIEVHYLDAGHRLFGPKLLEVLANQ